MKTYLLTTAFVYAGLFANFINLTPAIAQENRAAGEDKQTSLHNTQLIRSLRLLEPELKTQAVVAEGYLAQAQTDIPTTNLPSSNENSISQVTSVSQLSDVQPTDWAFQALQSLVERYGCIAGYPDGTYHGNRALTRYEFAAGLNACLDRVNELVALGTANLATKEDLATLQRLQEEFATELTTLRGA